jgi:hypothetical protein
MMYLTHSDAARNIKRLYLMQLAPKAVGISLDRRGPAASAENSE